MHLKKNKAKGIAINGIPIRKASELFGIVNVVFFSPEDLNIIKNGPAERRRFLDLELCQLNKLYVHGLIQYNRVVTQRNKLLKELSFHPEYEETLDIWDLQLAQYGRQVIEYRTDFVKQLNEKKENLGFIKAITDTSAYIKGINDAIEIVKERGQNKSHPKPRYIY